MLVEYNVKCLKDQKNRGSNTITNAIKTSRVNLQDNRTRHQNLAEQQTRRAKSGHSARTKSKFNCFTTAKNNGHVVRIQWKAA